MTQHNRRTFFKQAAAASAVFSGFTIAGTRASGRVIGANDTVRIGVAGINGRGSSHIDAYTKMDKVQVTYLIDPDSRLFGRRSEHVKSRGGNTPKTVQDVREALEDKELDAVSIATTNHWHSLITIWACQAGKDVYVEKPLSHNVHEGRIAVEAARKFGRIVQHGTQNRASSGVARQIAAAQSGQYGKLLVSKGYASKPRWSIGMQQPQQPPKELDFNLWLGPAPQQPYHSNLVHYNWHWFWNIGNGEIGNQGVHQMDIARWAIPGATLPTRVVSLGGRFGYEDQGQTANTQMSVFDYGETKLVFEVCGLVGGRSKAKQKVANEFYCEQGKIADGKFFPNGGGDPQPLVKVDVEMKPGDIFANFIHAMRTRQYTDLHADVLEAHYSSALCHLGNISYRLGEPAPFGSAPQSLGDNDVAAETFEALVRNLRDDNAIPLDGLSYRLGPVLRFDPQTERFVDAPQADLLLTRPPREPFAVPEKI